MIRHTCSSRLHSKFPQILCQFLSTLLCACLFRRLALRVCSLSCINTEALLIKRHQCIAHTPKYILAKSDRAHLLLEGAAELPSLLVQTSIKIAVRPQLAIEVLHPLPAHHILTAKFVETPGKRNLLDKMKAEKNLRNTCHVISKICNVC